MALGIRDHFIQAVGQHGRAITLHQSLDASVAHREHIHHGREVARDFGGQAHIGFEHGQQSVVQTALLIQLDRWDDDAFLVNLGGFGTPTTGHIAANVHPMAGGGEHGKQLATDKDGSHQLHVLQMAATQVGVVHDPDVAILEAALRIGQPNDVLHAELHVRQKHR